jgi:hypothetical protein
MVSSRSMGRAGVESLEHANVNLSRSREVLPMLKVNIRIENPNLKILYN